jgi:hypothetical protein
VIRVRAETAAIMIALRCRPTRVSCRLAYVEATPNACGTRWGPHGTPSESRRRGRVGCHEGPESSDPEAAAARCPDLGTPRADILRCLLGGAAGGLRHPSRRLVIMKFLSPQQPRQGRRGLPGRDGGSPAPAGVRATGGRPASSSPLCSSRSKTRINSLRRAP